MININEELHQLVETLPPELAQEVLDFTQFVLARRSKVDEQGPTQVEDDLSIEELKRILQLPIDERRKLLEQQAELALKDYPLDDEERTAWQGGDFYDY